MLKFNGLVTVIGVFLAILGASGIAHAQASNVPVMWDGTSLAYVASSYLGGVGPSVGDNISIATSDSSYTVTLHVLSVTDGCVVGDVVTYTTDPTDALPDLFGSLRVSLVTDMGGGTLVGSGASSFDSGWTLCRTPVPSTCSSSTPYLDRLPIAPADLTSGGVIPLGHMNSDGSEHIFPASHVYLSASGTASVVSPGPIQINGYQLQTTTGGPTYVTLYWSPCTDGGAVGNITGQFSNINYPLDTILQDQINHQISASLATAVCQTGGTPCIYFLQPIGLDGGEPIGTASSSEEVDFTMTDLLASPLSLPNSSDREITTASADSAFGFTTLTSGELSEMGNPLYPTCPFNFLTAPAGSSSMSPYFTFSNGITWYTTGSTTGCGQVAWDVSSTAQGEWLYGYVANEATAYKNVDPTLYYLAQDETDGISLVEDDFDSSSPFPVMAIGDKLTHVTHGLYYLYPGQSPAPPAFSSITIPGGGATASSQYCYDLADSSGTDLNEVIVVQLGQESGSTACSDSCNTSGGTDYTNCLRVADFASTTCATIGTWDFSDNAKTFCR